jgi:Domain of unknown function (DUF4126)
MNPTQIIAMTLGGGFSSGLNLYATVGALGIMERYGVIYLPEPLKVLAHPIVIGFAVGLYVLEFLADKIPYFDSVWDALHTFIRPPAAAILAYTVAGGAPAEWRWAAALVAGGVALTAHGTKAITRAAANTVPEPFSNWALSIGEDLLAVCLTWSAAKHPVATVIIVVVLLMLCAYLLSRLFRFARRAVAKF